MKVILSVKQYIINLPLLNWIKQNKNKSYSNKPLRVLNWNTAEINIKLACTVLATYVEHIMKWLNNQFHLKQNLIIKVSQYQICTRGWS